MALAENKKTGKAVAGISALYFYKHENGVEPVINAEMLQSDKWFSVLTLRGSVNTTQDAPSIEKILVDQFDQAIGITTEPGDFTFEAQLPSLLKEDIEMWLSEDIQVVEGATIDGMQLVGVNLDGKLYDVSAMVKTRTKGTILFTHVQVAFVFGQEGKTFLFRVSGQVLAPSNSANKLMYLATQAPAATE